MNAVKRGLEIDDAKAFVFEQSGTKKMQFSQFFESLFGMVTLINKQKDSSK